MWVFNNTNAADEHALVQYGDAILRGPLDLGRMFRPVELGRLYARLGAPERQDTISKLSKGERFEELVKELWDMMVRAAKQPPADPAEILSLVAQDRRATRQSGVIYRSQPTERETAMSDTDTDSTVAAETKNRPPARTPKIDPNSVISFGVDKEGKSFGPQEDGSFYNAKRAGSAANNRFALLQAGMTVQEAIDAGVTRADINWDVKQGFITLS